ncbi:BGTF surface domain-containing protein [Natronomonas amylolytica]|uniref:BGTF surface domain-containing protein n=1 Tax=Natronomonas amylolytica TaxID=3108498 RepID=UPI0030098DD8
MTDNNSKLRAVFLAALMVLWVFAGTMAFAGSAAAADGNTSATALDPSPNGPGETATYTVNVTLDSVESSSHGQVDGFQVNFTQAAVDAGLDASSVQSGDITVTREQADGTSATQTVDNAQSYNDRVFVGISSDSIGSGANDGTTYEIVIDNVQNPAAGDYQLNASALAGEEGSTSVGGGSMASFSVGNAQTAGADATWQTGGTLRWQGQGLFFDAEGQGYSEFQVNEWDNSASDLDAAIGSPVREFSLNDDGQRVLSTSNLEGDYVITATDSNGNRHALLTNSDGIVTGEAGSTADDPHVVVQVQSITTEFTDDEVNKGDNSTVEVDSARTDFSLNVTSDSFTGAELEELFPEATQIDSDTAQFTGVTNDPDELEFNTSSDELSFDLETGNYTFDFDVTDTTASDNASITVSEELAGDANFDESQYSAPRGDVVNITYSTQELDTTTLHVGGAEDGYNATLVLEPNDDGEVAVEMNTFIASDNSSNIEDAFEATKGNLVVEESTRDTFDYAIEEGTYDLEITAGDNETQDLSRLRITERSYDGLTVHTAPSNEFTRMQSKDRLLTRLNDGWVTESEEIAIAPSDRSNGRMGDVIVYEVEASGIEGYLETESGSDTTVQTLLDSGYFDLAIDQENPRQNRYPKALNVDDSAANNSFAFVPDTDNNTHYIVVKSDRLRFDRVDGGDDVTASGLHATPDDQFNTSFQITDNYESQFIRGDVDNVTNYADYEMVDREASFDTRGGNVTAQAVEGAEITGETTVAPGTELTLFVEGNEGDEGAPVFENSVTRVDEDGTFNATFDFSGAEDGQQFTATIGSQSFEDNAETPGVFGEATGASFDVSNVSLSSSSVQAGDDVDVSATITNSGDVEGNQTVSVMVDGTEVDSQEVSLAAGESTDMSSTISTSDLSGDVTVEVASADDSGSATLTVETEETETATPSDGTETAAPETDEPGTETPQEEQPGFGAVIALIALLGAALLAARRNAF